MLLPLLLFIEKRLYPGQNLVVDQAVGHDHAARTGHRRAAGKVERRAVDVSRFAAAGCDQCRPGRVAPHPAPNFARATLTPCS